MSSLFLDGVFESSGQSPNLLTALQEQTNMHTYHSETDLPVAILVVKLVVRARHQLPGILSTETVHRGTTMLVAMQAGQGLGGKGNQCVDLPSRKLC